MDTPLLQFSFVALIILATARPSFAGVHFTVKGTLKDNYLGLRKQANLAGSGSVAFDVGSHLRVGITHRQAQDAMQGYYFDPKNKRYLFASEEVLSVANSLDLTVILYYGDLVIPYLQVGIVKKTYHITKHIEGYEPIEDKFPMFPVPYGGAGVGLRLSEAFSLKISYTLSPGYIQEDPLSKSKIALDSYSSIGLSYNL